MPVLIILFVLAVSIYLYFRIKSVRMKEAVLKKIAYQKAAVALGTALGLFGLNRLFFSEQAAVTIVCFVFIVFGGLYALASIRALRLLTKNRRQSISPEKTP